jgi:hypothetical protein
LTLDYAEQESKVLYVPEKNEIVNTEDGLATLQFYAKRAKLMAAFRSCR